MFPQCGREVSLQICGEKGLGARDTRWERRGGYKGKCSNWPASSLARCGQAEQVDRRASWAGHKQPAGTCTAWTHVLWFPLCSLTSPDASVGPGTPGRSRVTPVSEPEPGPAHRTLTYSASGPIPDFSGQAKPVDCQLQDGAKAFPRISIVLIFKENSEIFLWKRWILDLIIFKGFFFTGW